MKQVLQDLKNGATILAEVPVPAVGRGKILSQTSTTLVSAGTERMLLDFGRANLLDKARQQPEKVRMVLDKIRTDGLAPTLDAVRNKLDQPLPMGYSNVGRVREVGSDVGGFAVGDRIVSNGWHSEYVAVPANLCARVPEQVTDEQAAFTVVAAIGLQGIRLAQPTIGESVVVSGLGLIGLLTVQLLKAQGCRVLGLDFDGRRLAMARQFGAQTVDLSAGVDPVAAAEQWTAGRGVDAVIITAATKSNGPVTQAAHMSRKRGRIILVGVAGLELSRADFYEKELSFQVSCSYGPGRYDPKYEEQGQDYPLAYVRWTEQRNFEAVLELMADGRLDLESLISHRFDIADAAAAYDVVGGAEASLGILLKYPSDPDSEIAARTVALDTRRMRTVSDRAVSFIGAGNYATSVLIPAFKGAGATLRTIACSAGVTGRHAGIKHGFERISTDLNDVFSDQDCRAVVIATRHDSHASLTCSALDAGKHVFVEKPLCLDSDELRAVTEKLQANPESQLMVGFNRRYSPLTKKLKSLLAATSGPKAMIMTVNAGQIPGDHWTQDPAIGGGRVIGEACHFVDLLRHVAAAPITDSSIVAMDTKTRDSVTISLRFADGSLGTIHYLANGSKAMDKERLEVFCDGGVLRLENFRQLVGIGWPGFRKLRLGRQDKGQAACARAFVESMQSGEAVIPRDELLEVAKITIELAEAAR